MKSSSPPPLLGRRLGEFDLRESIGGGAFGAIYLAEQVGLQRQAVVKVLRSRFADSPTTQLRFLREVQLASVLDHPYAAHIYAFGAEPDGVMWIAMELVRGTSLSEWLGRGPMPLGTFVPFFERLCEVVQTAHDHGIVHRDIKPANVMVITRAGALLPKLLDLGIAKDETASAALRRSQAGESSLGRGGIRLAIPPGAGAGPSAVAVAEGAVSPSSRPGGGLTEDGDLMGSPVYMAPEQWTDAESVDTRVDIYALGVLAYEVIAGRSPFSGSLEELAVQHLTVAVPALAEGLPRALHAVIAQAMAKSPTDRHASAMDLARQLRRASGVSDDALELPKLARDVADRVLKEYPQPIAEAVAELEGAGGALQALDAATRLARLLVRLLAVIALAGWQRVGRGRNLSPVADELLSALRKRRLSDEEWLELARAFVTPFVTRAEDHPVPEVPLFLRDDSNAAGTLAALLRRHAERGATTLPVEQVAAEELATVLTMTATVLRALSFLSDYPLMVAGADGQAELWMGVRRKHRMSRPLALRLETGAPVLVGEGDRIVPLSPLALARRPSPSSDLELFLIEGRGRYGVQLVAFPGGFEQTSEATLQWLDRMSVLDDQPESLTIAERSPYRGLAPLTAADTDVFFGREREVEALLNRLRTSPLVVVVGPSGAGKSSFVRAGVLPALGDAYRAVVFRPGATPLSALRAKLTQYGVQTDDLSTEAHAGTVASRAHAVARGRGETLVLCVDQFEEVFTLAHDGADRSVLCAWLAALSTSALDPVRVVLTLRDDFLSRMQQQGAFEQRLASALELLSTPGEAQLRRILVEPARRSGFGFETDALVDAMVHEVEGRAGALALLSFTASKLWEQRDVEAHQLRLAAYQAMGGVTGALAQHGEAVLARMIPKQRAAVREAFRRLVTSEGTRAITRHDDLLTALGDDETSRFVIEELLAARLIVAAQGDDGVEYVEVIHEALLEAWPRIVEWRREDAEGSRLREHLRAAADQWVARRRPRGLLWRDELVDDYRRWRRQNPRGLTASEEAFANASLAERDRGRRLRAAVIALLVLSAGVTSYVAWQQSLARQAAQRAAEEAQQANAKAERAAIHARNATRMAAVYNLESDPTTRLSILREIEGDAAPPKWQEEARRALFAPVSEAVLEGATDAIVSVAWSPDGKRVAFGGVDHMIRVHSADGSTPPVVLKGHESIVVSVSWSPDGKRIVSAGLNGALLLSNADGSAGPVVLAGKRGTTVAFSPDGERLAATASGALHIFRVDGTGDETVLSGHTDSVQSVAWSADGLSIVTTSWDKTVRVWSLDGRTPVRVLRGHTDKVLSAAFSPDGTRIVSGGYDKVVRIWRRDGRTPPIELRGPSEYVFSVDWSADGQHVVAASGDRTVRIWNADGSGDPLVFTGHTEGALAVAFSPDGARVASGGGDRSVRIWRARRSEEPLVLRGHTDSVYSVNWSPDGRRLASGATDATVRVWNADGEGAPAVFQGHEGRVNSVAWSPDGRLIASGSNDHTVRIWRSDGGGRPVVRKGHEQLVYDVDFSPDGRHLASASFDKTIRIWNAEEGGEPVVLRGHTDHVSSVRWSPDGRWVASLGDDRTVRVWSADGSDGGRVVLTGAENLAGLGWSPDGKRLVFGSYDTRVRVVNVDGSGDPIVLEGHANYVAAAVWSPGGSFIASSSGDGTVRIFPTTGGSDRNAGNDVAVLGGHMPDVESVAFSPDGKRLASASDDKLVRVWHDLRPIRLDDPRLWTATNYCLSEAQYTQVLGFPEELARTSREECQRRVASARDAVGARIPHPSGR